MDLAWEGLANSKDLNCNCDSEIYTEAWAALSPEERQRIKETIKNHKENGSKECI